jgi:hypothetical protein
MTVTRTMTEAEFSRLPSPLKTGRPSDDRLVSSAVGPEPRHVLALAALLEASGYGANDELAHLSSLVDAVDEEVRTATVGTDFAQIDPAALTPADAAKLIRDTAISTTITYGAHNWPDDASTRFLASIRPYAARAFNAYADTVVTSMRADFDQSVKAVTAAHAAGLRPDHNAAQIATDGTPKQIATFRTLASAVATLDRLADLRIRIHNLLDRPTPEPETRAIACFLAGPVDELAREGAANIFAGQPETVLVSSRTQRPAGTTPPARRRMAQPRQRRLHAAAQHPH